MKNFTKIFVSIFFVGYIKYAPGTWGSIVSLSIMYILFELLRLQFMIIAIIFIFCFFISNFFINYFSTITDSYDSKKIVIDELLGIFTIFLFYDLIFINNNILTYSLIFIIFRFFDIVKIYPANYFDKHYKNGYGVILDDIIAGLYTVITLIILNVFI
ncbi:phosphatidylglycerophosphatase A [Pelagibacterales bacterium SAG-MED31]|nr:phosphatidylglycerophosphatase A [Pelagibacterales bacterium SAG-MED31]